MGPHASGIICFKQRRHILQTMASCVSLKDCHDSRRCCFMMQILLVRALGPWLLQIGSVLSVHLLWTPQPPRPRRFASIAIALGETILRGPFLQQLLVAHWSLVAQIQARALWASLLSFERCMLFEPLQWWYMFVSMFESRQDPFDLLHLAATKSSKALKK